MSLCRILLACSILVPVSGPATAVPGARIAPTGIPVVLFAATPTPTLTPTPPPPGGDARGDPDVSAAEARVRKAERAVQRARRQLQRAERRGGDVASAARELDDAEEALAAAEAMLDDLRRERGL